MDFLVDNMFPDEKPFQLIDCSRGVCRLIRGSWSNELNSSEKRLVPTTGELFDNQFYGHLRHVFCGLSLYGIKMNKIISYKLFTIRFFALVQSIIFKSLICSKFFKVFKELLSLSQSERSIREVCEKQTRKQ